MRRMYSENQIAEIVKKYPQAVVKALEGQDISVEGITSKGIANTGNIANTGDIGASGKITGGEIVENMTGYSATEGAPSNMTLDITYAGAVKNGNKLTLTLFCSITPSSIDSEYKSLISFFVPEAVSQKCIPYTLGSFTNVLDAKKVSGYYGLSDTSDINIVLRKSSGNPNEFVVQVRDSTLTANRTYLIRYEATFLLSDSLISE